MIRLAILAVGRGEMSLHSAAVCVRLHSVLSVVPMGNYLLVLTSFTIAKLKST